MQAGTELRVSKMTTLKRTMAALFLLAAAAMPGLAQTWLAKTVRIVGSRRMERPDCTRWHAKEIIDKISKDVAEIIKQPAVREKVAAQLMEPVGSSPEEPRARMDGEIVRWDP